MPRQHDPALLAAIGARIRTLRAARGLTQEALAERARIEPRTLSHVENGHHGASVTALAAMAEVLGVSLGDLVDVRREVPPAPPAPSPEEWLALWEGMDGRQRALAMRLVREVAAG